MNTAKEAKFVQLSEAVLRTLATHGENGLQVARIARAAKISRAWIYKYVGKNQADLVSLAVQRFAAILRMTNRTEIAQTPKDWIQFRLESTRYFLQVTEKYPYIVTLYYRYRGSPTHYGRLIGHYEREHFEKFSQETQKALSVSPRKGLFFAQAFMALRFGLAHQLKTNEGPSDANIERLVKLLEHVLESMLEERGTP